MKGPSNDVNNVEVFLMKNVTDVVTSKINACQDEGGDEAFFVCDLGNIVQKYKLWTDLFPRVKPYFDVKCNNDTAVLTVLAQLDVGFNYSCKNDLKAMLDIGVSASRLIYSSPCKLSSHIKYAASHGVQLIEFESETELYKIKSLHPHARLIFKLLPPDSEDSGQPLNFGCRLGNVSELLCVASRLDLNIVGISIHAENGCLDIPQMTKTLSVAHSVFQMAEMAGFHLTLLDIGEILPKTSSGELSLEDSCSILQVVLDEFFPLESGVELIAESGRFLVESAFTLVARVIEKTVVAKRFPRELAEPQSATRDPDIIYYLSDGIFRSFSGILYNELTIKPSLIDCERFTDAPKHASRLLGPTQDSLDCIVSDCFLPELFIGDWILFNNMGAYTMAGSVVSLNDDEMTRPVCHYTMRAKDWIHLCCCSTDAGMPQVRVMIGAESSSEWLDI